MLFKDFLVLENKEQDNMESITRFRSDVQSLYCIILCPYGTMMKMHRKCSLNKVAPAVGIYGFKPWLGKPQKKISSMATKASNPPPRAKWQKKLCLKSLNSLNRALKKFFF